MIAHTTSRTLPTCDINLGSLTLPALEAGDFVEYILLYGVCQIWSRPINYRISLFAKQNTCHKTSKIKNSFRRLCFLFVYKIILFPTTTMTAVAQ